MAPTFPVFPSSPANGSRSFDNEKGVNVQVLVRCRPLNEEELQSHTLQVVTCNDQRREVMVNLNSAYKQICRSFTFDKVFGPQAQQKELYEQAISPLVNEVLEGFNCTVFAYGQTGTGKTYTMEGGNKTCSMMKGDLPKDAGVIPRAVQQIVDTLEYQNAEYSMKVTFLELYNEEITDLLAPSSIEEMASTRPMSEDRSRSTKPLTLMEDGKGGVLVRGLEEEIVFNANEIYALLERGSAKRRTAETLLNKQSSRSHSIFSITIYIKESTPEGDELIKCGKLNLVDLAGSENISRSGARDGRAREVGEINKSLLTLGRVITSLVEHLGHIPYRDSKLTRLLRDSLGGKTKTCIIATVSSSIYCLEETLSTLDYAYRAKNIRNRPEVNQKMLKAALIKDLYGEIEKLKTELYATREKNGIYLPKERYVQEEAERKAMSQKIESMELELDMKGKGICDLQEALAAEQQECATLAAELEDNQRKLDQTMEALADGKSKLKHAESTIKERDFIIARLLHSEAMLAEQAESLHSSLENSINDIAGLHVKIDRKSKLEMDNLGVVKKFHGNLGQQLKALQDSVMSSVEQQQQQLKKMGYCIGSFLDIREQETHTMQGHISDMKGKLSSRLSHVREEVQAHEKGSTCTLQNLNATISAHTSALEELYLASVSEVEEVLQALEKVLSKQQAATTSLVQQQQEVVTRCMDASKEISGELVTCIEVLEQHTAELTKDATNGHKNLVETLSDFDRVFKEQCQEDEKMMIEKVAALISAATARKCQSVESFLVTVQNTSDGNARTLQQRATDIQSTTSHAHTQWLTYVEQAEDDFCEALMKLNREHDTIQSFAQQGVISVAKSREDWKGTKEAVEHFDKNNLLAVDLIVKEGTEENRKLVLHMEEAMDLSQSDLQVAHGACMDSIEGCIETDKQMVETIKDLMAVEGHALEELQNSHISGIQDIESQAESCFKQEYLEDVPTCTTPRKKTMLLPSQASIAALRAPCIERIVQEFMEASPDKGPEDATCMQVKPDSKMFISAESSSPITNKDVRVPLTAVN